MSLPTRPESSEQIPVGLTAPQQGDQTLHLVTQMVGSTKTWGTAVFVSRQSYRSPVLCTFESNYCISIVLLPNNLKCEYPENTSLKADKTAS